MLFLLGLVVTTAWALGRMAARHSGGDVRALGQRVSSASRETVRLRTALVGCQVAAATTLLLAAGLLLQSAARLLAVDPGFRTDQVIAFAMGIPPHRYPMPIDRVQFIDRVVSRLQALPGVTAASSAATEPMSDMRATRRFAIGGRPLPEPGNEPLAIDSPAGPSYAEVLGLRILDGRWIGPGDRMDTPPVVVISESFAAQFFRGERAVGQRLRYFAGRPGAPEPPSPEIVGVVSDVRQFGIAESTRPQMYTPHAQRAFAFASFFVRTIAEPASVMAAIVPAVLELDPERPVERLQVIGELVAASTRDRRSLSLLLGLAAVVALLIAAIGVYGVTAAATEARRRELAIRAAMGANRPALLRMAIGPPVVAAAVGVCAGLAAAAGLADVLTSVLYEVPPRDPLTFGVAGTVLLAVAGMAAFVPARRAVTANPVAALREPA